NGGGLGFFGEQWGIGLIAALLSDGDGVAACAIAIISDLLDGRQFLDAADGLAGDLDSVDITAGCFHVYAAGGQGDQDLVHSQEDGSVVLDGWQDEGAVEMEVLSSDGAPAGVMVAKRTAAQSDGMAFLACCKDVATFQ